MPNSVIVAILSGLAMGVVFGFALEKSRVFEPGAFVGQMQLRNFFMLKIFLTAVATGALVLGEFAELHGLNAGDFGEDLSWGWGCVHESLAV